MQRPAKILDEPSPARRISTAGTTAESAKQTFAHPSPADSNSSDQCPQPGRCQISCLARNFNRKDERSAGALHIPPANLDCGGRVPPGGTEGGTATPLWIEDGRPVSEAFASCRAQHSEPKLPALSCLSKGRRLPLCGIRSELCSLENAKRQMRSGRVNFQLGLDPSWMRRNSIRVSARSVTRSRQAGRRRNWPAVSWISWLR